MKIPSFITSIVALCIICAFSPIANAQVPDQLEDEAGSVMLKEYRQDGILIGRYWQYLPAGTSADYAVAKPIGSDPLTIVVLIHGSISTDTEAENTAENFINRYTADADANWFAVIAPIFTDTDFNGPLGGYRGMLGRHRTGIEPRKTDADGFINGIINEYKHKHPEVINSKSLFYGHSAGGQCLSRYLVTHPGRVASAVISAAGSYAFPDDTINWTDGMDILSRTISWAPAADRDFEFEPSSSAFSRAARLPITVMVGDNEAHHEIPLSNGTPGFQDGSNPPFDTSGNPNPDWNPIGSGTRHLRGSLWVEAMRDFADLDAADPGVEFQSLPGIQHFSAQTQPVALGILLANKPTRFDIEWLGAAMGPILMH